MVELIGPTHRQLITVQSSPETGLDSFEVCMYACFIFYDKTFYYKNTNDKRSSGPKSLLLNASARVYLSLWSHSRVESFHVDESEFPVRSRKYVQLTLNDIASNLRL